MTRVWLYPEREKANLGDTRWLVSTWIVLPEAMTKEEIDPDVDVVTKNWSFGSHSGATKKAYEVLTRDDLAYGAVTIQEQTVDWFVREDGIGEWVDVGEQEDLP